MATIDLFARSHFRTANRFTLCLKMLREDIMALYRHRQFSLYVVVSFGLTSILLCGIFWLTHLQPYTSMIFAGALALAAVVHFLVSALTVEVSERELTWSFRLGTWRKHIARADIAGVNRVRLPWWYGIGVKYTPRGWAYLVAPGDAIQVALTNGKLVCIGTDDPDGLAAALARPAA